MAVTVRYRYVDFGTVFTGDPRLRGGAGAIESPGTLFANELVTDVGGTCWGSNEPLGVIDHHFSGEGQFPSASAAVLHKAKLIRHKFGDATSDVIWMVSHKEPDFDAFCSMYLARWIIEGVDATVDWESYGLHPEGWLDLPHRPKIDWFNPDLSHVPPQHRWPLLLASYASVLDSRRRVSCPRQRELNSVLQAALKRGRDYLSETSGATEFFDEARRFLQQGNPNPIFDSVMEGSAEFAPELAMLDHESQAYERDIRRARKSIVYLPQAEAPSPKFFKSPKEVALLEVQGKTAEVNAEDLLLADTFRVPTAGIYLRDPECRLFQEWARLDLENASLDAGFEFTAIATSNGRPAGTLNQTDYVFSIDPERANGRHLYTLWSRLETKEVQALRAQQETSMPVVPSVRISEQHSATLGTLLSDPWFGGQGSFGTLVRTPGRGTVIAPPGVRSDLRDDSIGEEVRTELEDPIYSAESLVAGPQVTVLDLAGLKNHGDLAARQLDLNAPLKIPPPPQGYFRFAAILLRADVPIVSGGTSGDGLGQQIGETLWQVLYPETPGSIPSDFVERHLIATPTGVGVWGDRGIAMAQKHPRHSDAASTSDHSTLADQDDFASIVSLARDIEQFKADAEFLSGAPPDPTNVERNSLEGFVARGEELALHAAEVQPRLTSPDRELLRRFSDVIGVDQLLATLRELNQTAAEHLRRKQSAEEAMRKQELEDKLAKEQSKLEWLKVFIAGFIAIVIVDVVARQVDFGNALRNALLLLVGPAVLGVTAWALKPWKRKPKLVEGSTRISATILAAAIAACIAGWLAGLLRIWGK